MNGENALERLVQACGGVYARRCEEEEDRLAEKICQRAIQKALFEANNEMNEVDNEAILNEGIESSEIKFELVMKKSHSVPTKSDEWEQVTDEDISGNEESEEAETVPNYEIYPEISVQVPQIHVNLGAFSQQNIPQLGFGMDADNLGCPIIAIQGPTPIASRCVSPRKEELESDELVSSDEQKSQDNEVDYDFEYKNDKNREVEEKQENSENDYEHEYENDYHEPSETVKSTPTSGHSTPTSGHSTPDEDVMSPFSYWLDECSQNLTQQIITESLAEECQVLADDLAIINESVQLVDSSLAALQEQMASLMHEEARQIEQNNSQPQFQQNTQSRQNSRQNSQQTRNQNSQTSLQNLQDEINQKYHGSTQPGVASKSFEQLEFEKYEEDFASNSSGNEDATPINEYGMRINEMTPIHQLNFGPNPFENTTNIENPSLHSSKSNSLIDEHEQSENLPSAADLHRDVSQYCYWKTEPVVWTNYSLNGVARHDPTISPMADQRVYDPQKRISEMDPSDEFCQRDTGQRDYYQRQPEQRVPREQEIDPRISKSDVNPETQQTVETPKTPTNHCRISQISCDDFEIDEMARMICKSAVENAVEELRAELGGRSSDGSDILTNSGSGENLNNIEHNVETNYELGNNSVEIRTGETDLDIFPYSQNECLQVGAHRSRHTSVLTNSSSQNSFNYDLMDPSEKVSENLALDGLSAGVPQSLSTGDNQSLLCSEEPFNRPISPMPPR